MYNIIDIRNHKKAKTVELQKLVPKLLKCYYKIIQGERGSRSEGKKINH